MIRTSCSLYPQGEDMRIVATHIGRFFPQDKMLHSLLVSSEPFETLLGDYPELKEAERHSTFLMFYFKGRGEISVCLCRSSLHVYLSGANGTDVYRFAELEVSEGEVWKLIQHYDIEEVLSIQEQEYQRRRDQIRDQIAILKRHQTSLRRWKQRVDRRHQP